VANELEQQMGKLRYDAQLELRTAAALRERAAKLYLATGQPEKRQHFIKAWARYEKAAARVDVLCAR
jgi:hypothetical protein